MPNQRCTQCGNEPTSFVIDGEPYCDRCADRHVSPAMGLPLLPDPPPPAVIVGPDRRRHTLVFRIWRAPTGIRVDRHEQRRNGSEGYEFAVLGGHDADIDQLIQRCSPKPEPRSPAATCTTTGTPEAGVSAMPMR